LEGKSRIECEKRVTMKEKDQEEWDKRNDPYLAYKEKQRLAALTPEERANVLKRNKLIEKLNQELAHMQP
jgi:hypothetical protein